MCINENRLREDFKTLSHIGATHDGGISRPALSLEDLEARAWFADRIEEAGFFVRDDDAGNLSGILPSHNPDARTLLIGSHLDSVPNGGCYDGAIGVLAGLEVMRTVQQANLDLPVNLEVINFTDEEGTWFSLLGSRSLTGQLPLGRLSARHGADGALRAALSRAGIDIDRLHLARREPESIAAYLELHIEQSGTLDRLDAQIGAVRGVVGRTTFEIVFHGESGHSGTTDIYQRRDALQGAALFITRAHMLVQDRMDGSVVNCGNLEVSPGTFNVIPSRARLLVEVRHVDRKTLSDLQERVTELAQECAGNYGLMLEHRQVEHMDAAIMDERIIGITEQVANKRNLQHTSVVSYAGHDAQPMSAFTPTGMIFVPSVGGISHNPAEKTHWPDVVHGSNVLLQVALTVAEQFA